MLKARALRAAVSAAPRCACGWTFDEGHDHRACLLQETAAAMPNVCAQGFPANDAFLFPDPFPGFADNADLVTMVAGRTYLSTPLVTEAARRHFACPSLPGAELEGAGGNGTAQSHLESQIFQGDLMQGKLPYYQSTSESRLVLSDLVLSYLQDTNLCVPLAATISL